MEMGPLLAYLNVGKPVAKDLPLITVQLGL